VNTSLNTYFWILKEFPKLNLIKSWWVLFAYDAKHSGAYPEEGFWGQTLFFENPILV